MASDVVDQLIQSISSLSTSYDAHKNSFIKNTQEKTPLHAAAAIDGVDTCRRLVAEGADINAKCQDFHATAMHYAALNEKHGLEVIEYFTNLKMRVDIEDKNGKEPILYAIRAKNFKIAEKLLKLWFPEGELSKNNLLHLCVKKNNLEMAKIVLNHDKHLMNKYGEDERSTIHIAAFYADLEMFKWLLSEGADVRALTKDKFEENVLHCSACNTSHGTELVQFLVSKLRFDVNAKDKLGYTPLHYAFWKNNIKTAEELLKLGAELTVKRITNDSNNLENLMHFCVKWNKMKSAKFLQEKNRNLVRDLRGDGETSLHIAAEHAGLGMCKWLVDECGLDPLALARNQKLSVLECAACNKSHGKEIIQYLVDKYSLDVNRKDEGGFTPLHQAFFNNNIVAAEELVRLGADLTVKREANNLLHESVIDNKVESVKYLIEKLPGLLVEPGPGGKTIVQLATENGDKAMMKLLTEKGCKF
ncbi:Hypothetical predicted protein [Cloeon dipterum]|uniref:PRANC domain-containing protein n=1 Tax=Cloeon dipterum TaxID=197152 RepID=A0A8S1DF04_9INSE|nr:Hypothetical predicted protein [Cloeon dipterum]